MIYNHLTQLLFKHKRIIIYLVSVLIVICEFIFRFDNVHSNWVLMYRLLIFQGFLWIIFYCLGFSLKRKMYLIILFLCLNLGFYCISADYYKLSLFKQSYYLVSAKVTEVFFNRGVRGSSITIKYEYNWLNSPQKQRNYVDDVSGEVRKDNISTQTNILLMKHESGWGHRYRYNITQEDAYYYQYPVLFVKGVEFGNDYYYYAKLQPINALNNYGLRRVTKSIDKSDTILLYRNLNHAIDSVSYRLADTLQTASNRALVGDSFAFLFHEGIYSKEQVFDEIPQAKEYYLKYCKETDSTTNIISDTTNTP